MVHARARSVGVAILLVAACDRTPEAPPTSTSESPETKRATPPKTADVDPCTAEALSLGAATLLQEWKPPAGCTENAAQGTSVHRTDAELTAQLECDAATRHGVDLTKHSVIRVTDSMSPATVGWLAYDDGKAITLVTKFRSPCPNDPRPMPMSATRWYLAPTTERKLAEASCTIHPACPK